MELGKPKYSGNFLMLIIEAKSGSRFAAAAFTHCFLKKSVKNSTVLSIPNFELFIQKS